MRSIYTFIIRLYVGVIRLMALFSSKAKLWVDGRVNLFDIIAKDFEKIDGEKEEIVWIHCASLGEFEQGRPLIEKLKERETSVRIVLTFFSPSGYEVRKNYAGADFIYYLPADTPVNTKRFLDLVQPNSVFFVKYEFWFNYLNELQKRNISTYLVSGIFRAGQHFFKPYGGWFRYHLNSFTHCYLQDYASEKLLNGVGYMNTSVVGDTRFDRVVEIAENVRSFPLISEFKSHKKLIVAGSTWSPDEELLAELNLPSFGSKLLIAPHEIDKSHVLSIQNLFLKKGYKVMLYSQAEKGAMATIDVLIVDSIGMLSSLYQYGHLAYIGGGFGSGIHNTLEAVTFGLPVVFGPKYQKFSEAVALVSKGAGFSIASVEELTNTVGGMFGDNEKYESCSVVARTFVVENSGATDAIVYSIWDAK